MADDVEYVKVTSQKLNFILDNPNVLGILVAIIAVIITLRKYVTRFFPSIKWKIPISQTYANITSLGSTICMRILLICCLFSVIFTLYRRSKSKRNGVLLLGLCDSGKTLIFARLLSGKYVQTHTSSQENTGDYLAGNVSEFESHFLC